MTTLGTAEFYEELGWQNLPSGWFDPDGPVVKALLAAYADPAAYNFSQLLFDAQQARLATASGAFLDMLADDFLGKGLFKRRAAETDTSYRARIKTEILRPRATRQAIINAVESLTGTTVTVFEPNNVRDVGGYSDGSFAWGRSRWGTLSRPYEFFMDVELPKGPGIPNRTGWNVGGWGQMSWGDRTKLQGAITEDEVRAQIVRNIPAGVICWLKIGLDASQPIVVSDETVNFPIDYDREFSGTQNTDITSDAWAVHAISSLGNTVTITVAAEPAYSSVPSGTYGLPPGMTLTSDGRFIGTPTMAGTYFIEALATSSTGVTSDPNNTLGQYTFVIAADMVIPVVVQGQVRALSPTEATTITLAHAPTLGNILVACVSGANTITASSGWVTLHTEAGADNLWVGYRPVPSGATVYTPTGVTGGGAVAVWEVQGASSSWTTSPPTFTINGLVSAPTL
jgi:hypothetical protein